MNVPLSLALWYTQNSVLSSFGPSAANTISSPSQKHLVPKKGSLGTGRSPPPPSSLGITLTGQ